MTIIHVNKIINPKSIPKTVTVEMLVKLGWSESDAKMLISIRDMPTTTVQPEWLSQALNEGDGTYKP